MQRVRHADGAERRLLQVRKLRQHERLQLRKAVMNQNDWMSGLFGTLPPQQRAHVSPSRRTHFPRPLPLVQKVSAFVASRIVREVLTMVDSHGFSRESWFAGITGDPRARLIQGHGLRSGDLRKVWDAGSETVARLVEKELLRLGIDGGTGGGNEVSTKFVYVFLKQPHTRR